MPGMYLVLVFGYFIRVQCLDNESEYRRDILEAQCTSRCLELYGDTNPYPTSKLYNVYTAKDCWNSNCKQCTNSCEDSAKSQKNRTCDDVCESAIVPNVCHLACDFFTVQRTNADNGIVMDDTSRITTFDPAIVCMYTEDSRKAGNPHVATVYLRWDMYKTDLSEMPQMQFIISLQRYSNTSNESPWASIGKTSSSFLPIRNLTLNTTYRFKVTAVSEKGLVDDAKMTEFVTTLADNHIPIPPENVEIEMQTYYKQAVSAKISWSAAKDKSCFYKIYWLPSCKQSKIADFVEEEIKTPPAFVYWMNRLQFDCNYTVSIYSFPTPLFTGGSKVTKMSFQTLQCLNATNFNYTVCKPEEPQNISAIEKIPYMTEGVQRGNTTFTWEPPPHAGPNNKLTGYILEWSKEIPLHMGPLVDPDKGSIALPPNLSNCVIPEMHWSSKYRIQIRATSIGGTSDPFTIFVDLGAVHYSDELNNATSTTILDTSENKVFIGSTVAVLILILTAAILIFRYLHRKKRPLRVKRISRTEETNPLYDNSYASNGVDVPIILDEYEVDFSMLLLLNSLGEGAFGKVVKAELVIPRKDGKDAQKVIVAVKMLKDHPDVVEKRSLLKEIEAMKQLGHHQNIVSIIGCCTKNNEQICLIMDYCPLGDLRQYLHQLRPRTQYQASSGQRHEDSGMFSNMTEDTNEPDTPPITQARLLSYARQIAMGMEYLAEKKYVHRDLAARNILMFDFDRLKLSDFGLTRDVYETNMYQPTSARKLPYKWMALEAIYDQIFTTKSDVWSFGIVLWEIVTLGGSPYPGIPNEDLFRLLKDGYRMENPGNCSTDIYQIMLSCWHPRPHSRPSFVDLRQKLEAMLEATKAYINLSVSVSDDYYRSSDSFSSKEGENQTCCLMDQNSDVSYLEAEKYDKSSIYNRNLSDTDMSSLMNGGYHSVFVNERNDGIQHDLCNSMCRFCNIPRSPLADSKLLPDRSSNLYEEPITLMASLRASGSHRELRNDS
ncbi:tyrosine-protein kinase receptor TYRO3-like [Pecten maximus]|uniref:tyrosine-protein kinase receptor TYRO3-like n=1 Tax=Pecten maximus TaxID=6579 RepID=UPI00145872B5|nr:tyrosine-protein kinase receptor TYRO3-like [Pecten maximus]XP_033756440.1 tyrosine-protein kinase receptor TYRO3-like [Pecten maximus]